MATDHGRDAAGDREAIDANVRRIVGFAALRRVQRLIGEREESDRVLRTVVAPIAVVVMIVVAALIWRFGSPRIDASSGPLPECAPARAENVTT